MARGKRKAIRMRAVLRAMSPEERRSVLVIALGLEGFKALPVNEREAFIEGWS